ncbi:MAG: fibronectin type III domain-containing protein, partial [Planctomycetaceae bacterium]|jgi:predicted outer membrane repeat protein|nr:fibronectin type III domain-containing protein [Planctomycetaceae bacterium]
LEYKTSDSNWNDAISVTLDANADSYTAVDLTASTEYQFRLTATNESGKAVSQIVTATTNVALPTTPLLEIAAFTYQSVALVWAGQENLDRYELEYKKSDSNRNDAISVTHDANSESYTAFDLTASTEYQFRLTATNESGKAVSQIVTATTNVALPTMPLLEIDTVTYQSVAIVWAGQENLDKYELEYKTSDSNWNDAIVVTLDANAESYTVIDLTASTEYQFRLTATNESGEAVSQIVTATTNVALPTAPLLEIDAITYQSVALVWAGQENLDRYELEYKTSDSNWNDAIVVTLDANAESYTVIDLTASTEYQFRLIATNESGKAVSQIVTATTFARPSLIVTTLDDIVDPLDGLVSLREAISWVTPTSHVIFFDPGLFINGSQIITLQSELLITTATTINAPGATLLTLDANQSGRHLTIRAQDQDVVINGLTFANGNINKNGGAIYLDGGNLVLTGVTFSNNTANNKFGGALYQNAGTVAMIGVTFDRNTSKNGGAYFQMSGDSSLAATTFINNNADYGGAFYLYGGTSAMLGNYWGQTQFFGNTGKWGGAIYQSGGSLQLEHVWFSFNTATWGGGIFQNNGNLTAQNTSLQYNAATWGGGLYFGGNGTTTLLDVKLTENSGSQSSGSAIAKVVDSKLAAQNEELETILDEALQQYLEETVF